MQKNADGKIIKDLSRQFVVGQIIEELDSCD